MGNDTLASTYPNLFMLATCLLEGSWIWAPNFRRRPHQFMRANIHNDLKSLLNLLQSIQLSNTPDVRKLNRNGLFTVNSLYRHLTGNCFRWIWTTQVPLKTKVHMWLSYHERLLTVDILDKRGIYSSPLCLLCRVTPESVAHIFLHCLFTFKLWAPERNCLAISSRPSSIATPWGDWRFLILHLMKLTSKIMLLPQSLELFGKSTINRFLKQNPLLHWSLVVGLHPWCLLASSHSSPQVSQTTLASSFWLP